MKILDHPSLKSLESLENIEAGNIASLTITGNDSLTHCSVKSICNYLAAPNGVIEIHDNAQDCNSQEEVVYGCLVGIETKQLQGQLSILPNPFTTTTTIKYNLPEHQTVQISIFNHLGKQVEVIQQNQSQGKQELTWDASGLPSGVYYFRMQVGEQVASGKLLLVK